MSNPETVVDHYLMMYISRLDPWRIEDRFSEGIPDINHKYGWIEVKQRSEWPVKPETIVAFPKFTKFQRDTIRARNRAGGICHVFVRVDTMNMLFWGTDAADNLGKNWTKQDMLDNAIVSWRMGTSDMVPNDPRIINAISTGRGNV